MNKYHTLADAPSWQSYLAEVTHNEYDVIPVWVFDSIYKYVRYGYHPMEDSITALLTQNLSLLMGSADDYTLSILRPIWKFIYNCIPSSAWGSKEAVTEWCKKGGVATISFYHDPEFEIACGIINHNWVEGFDRADAVRVLREGGYAPTLCTALSEMTFEEWEDFVVNYLEED